ncbi:fructosamine kinase family protein [Cellulomonas fimi]|uniref:fructosamine kinase family protein n=1 Tax=Cellulomonas fimi TaxID=1708 RepID=UPI00234C61CD|nr:fructosamine kinase family protein [Cellulomonas fimi]MDC7122193.1 fructosamine kinase family protein [Cellulomonas fimi]
MPGTDLIAQRLAVAGFDDVTDVTPLDGGMIAVAGLAQRRSGTPVFAKTLEAGADGMFDAEAEGLHVLRERGGLRTPDVLHVAPDLLVLEALAPRVDTTDLWERLAHAVAHLHTSTTGTRFGWHRDNFLGRMRQDNTWDDDGFEFYARRRLLRWLPEPRVQAAFDEQDRRALEHLCDRLTELLPPAPPCLTHGDFWSSNVIATPDGAPALIDPAVSMTWAEVDIAMLWSEPRPPESDRFFDVYAEVVGLDAGWKDRMPLLFLRQELALVAMFDHDWGAAERVRALLAPYRRRLPSRVAPPSGAPASPAAAPSPAAVRSDAPTSPAGTRTH